MSSSADTPSTPPPSSDPPTDDEAKPSTPSPADPSAEEPTEAGTADEAAVPPADAEAHADPDGPPEPAGANELSDPESGEPTLASELASAGLTLPSEPVDTGSTGPSEPAPAGSIPPSPPESKPASEKKRSFLRRFFLMEQRLEQAKAVSFTAEVPGYAQFELASAALEGVDSLLEVADRQDGALLLTREAAVLGVRAHVARAGKQELGSQPVEPAEFWAEFQRLPQSGKALDSLPTHKRDKIGSVIIHDPATGLAKLSKNERAETLTALLKFLRPLIADLRTEADRIVRVRLIRQLRFVITLIVLGALCFGGYVLVQRLVKTNFALNKPVTQSSYYKKERFPPGGVVDGDRNTIGGHSRKQNRPWIRIDLGKLRTVRKVVVVNRLENIDRFGARAVPLLIEVSGDGKAYKQFARRNDQFTTWTAKGQAIQARYVRLTALKNTELHLNEVEIY